MSRWSSLLLLSSQDDEDIKIKPKLHELRLPEPVLNEKKSQQDVTQKKETQEDDDEDSPFVFVSAIPDCNKWLLKSFPSMFDVRTINIAKLLTLCEIQRGARMKDYKDSCMLLEMESDTYPSYFRPFPDYGLYEMSLAQKWKECLTSKKSQLIFCYTPVKAFERGTSYQKSPLQYGFRCRLTWMHLTFTTKNVPRSSSSWFVPFIQANDVQNVVKFSGICVIANLTDNPWQDL